MPSRGDHIGARERRDRLRLTFAYRSNSRTIALPRAMAIVLLLLLPFAALLYLGATCYFIFHDDLLASLTRRQIEMQYAYEDRIAALRRELENTAQNARTEEADFADRLQVLAQRQDQIESRTTLVAALADRMNKMHSLAMTAGELASSATSTPEIANQPPPQSSNPDVSVLVTPFPPPDGKPHPEGFDLRLPKGAETPSNGDAGSPSQTSANATSSPIGFDADAPLHARIDYLIERYNQVDRTDLTILSALRSPASRVAERIRFALASAGLTADHLNVTDKSIKQNAAGGPFVALPILSDGSPFATAAVEAEDAMETAEKLSRVLPHVPVAAPLSGKLEVTSPFGPRLDPFLGKPALHTGVDLYNAYGASVRATAIGTVRFAGPDGGYGNLVEVDHGNGLTTRYAHLSSINVEQGQSVGSGQVLGRIGDTGRATGPHLHYEVRIDGQPIDPERFLKAGSVLAGNEDL